MPAHSTRRSWPWHVVAHPALRAGAARAARRAQPTSTRAPPRARAAGSPRHPAGQRAVAGERGGAVGQQRRPAPATPRCRQRRADPLLERAQALDDHGGDEVLLGRERSGRPSPCRRRRARRPPARRPPARARRTPRRPRRRRGRGCAPRRPVADVPRRRSSSLRSVGRFGGCARGRAGTGDRRRRAGSAWRPRARRARRRLAQSTNAAMYPPSVGSGLPAATVPAMIGRGHLRAQRGADGAHERVDADRLARLGGRHGRHDQVRDRGEHEAEADRHERRCTRSPRLASRGTGPAGTARRRSRSRRWPAGPSSRSGRPGHPRPGPAKSITSEPGSSSSPAPVASSPKP